MVPEGEALKLVPQDPGFDIRPGVCGGSIDYAHIEPLNEELEGVWVLLGKGESVVRDDGAEEGRMVREQILWDAPGGGCFCITHSHEDGG